MKKMKTEEHPRPDTVREWLRRGPSPVHLVGIGGVGMAGLAGILAARGWQVSGCDSQPNRLATWMERRGVRVFHGHDPAHVEQLGEGWMIRSRAVPDGCPEIVRAYRLGVPIFVRGEVLAELLTDAVLSVAVSGTHGKTSTSWFLVQILQQAGFPTGWCIGGVLGADRADDGAEGGPSEWVETGPLVVEADESDGTLALYAPDMAIITNVDRDHLDHFGSEQELENCFRIFARSAKRRLIVCADDPRAARIAAAIPGSLTYGFTETAYARATEYEKTSEGQRFRLRVGERDLGRITLPFRGSHYALNSLAATLAALEMGVPPDRLAEVFLPLRLPARRFDCVVTREDVRVITDYAHHPTEIAAVLRMVPPGGRKLAIFQPHRYTRTRDLADTFPPVFAGVDDVIITPVYAASESPVKGGTHWDLYRSFASAAGRTAVQVRLADSLEQAWTYCRRVFRPGDTLLILGAGDVERVGEWAQKEPSLTFLGTPIRLDPSRPASIREGEPLAGKTTLKVGGHADYWVEVPSREALQEVHGWARARGLPVHVLGGGSNVLVSDLGVRGVTVRLVGDFRRIRLDATEPEIVHAGAGVPLAALLDRVEEYGLTGLEFLEGIPGTVGGAIRMNAGAWGHAIGETVCWIHCLNPDGSLCIVPADQMGFAYRHCAGLGDRIVWEVSFRLRRDSAEAVHRRRVAVADRRRWTRGLRCAGSAFLNPPDDSAGRLIEAAGLKGAAVGGARVLERHANWIVTRPGATASDVAALLAFVRTEVADRFGVDLTPEIVLLA